MSATTRFETWGTYVFLGVREAEHLAEARRLAEAVLGEIDRTCSRFRTDSDLSRANRAHGRWIAVEPLLVAAVEIACLAAEETDGLVDPLLGRPLVQLGYDRDFALLHERTDLAVDLVPNRPHRDPDAWRALGLDLDGAIRVPPGTALDLGATAKAWAADLVAATVSGELDAEVLVSVGGDICIGGDDPTPWPIGISERPGTAFDELVELDSGGLATSSTRARRWSRGGVELHHLLDPRTGLPVPETWRTVTATGPTCVAANAATTAAVVLGRSAPEWLEARGVTARLVAADGRVVATGGWPVGPSGAGEVA